jgi:hypothetical protein
MKLSSKQRKSLPDSDFGLITDSGERKYPMHDKRHVILAIRMFKHCPPGKEKELAAKIGEAQNKKYSLGSLSQKLRNETISYKEVKLIAQILGYKIAFIDTFKFNK